MEMAGEARNHISNSYVVLILCSLAAMVDGFDAAALGYALPVISHQWGLPLPSFGMALTASPVGIVVGALVLTPFGDKIGRRYLMIATGIEVALVTVAVAFTNDIWLLTALRFLTGVGLGALTPLLAAIAYEAPADRHRQLYVTVLMIAFPIGAFLGGLVAAWALPRYGWEALFVATGLLMGFAVVSAFLFYREDKRPVEPRQETVDNSVGIMSVFREHSRMTMLVWALFIGNLFVVYTITNWLPSLINRAGFDTSTSVALSGLANLGGSAGGLVLGYLIARFGIVSLVFSNIAAAALFAALPMIHDPIVMSMICTAIGFMIIGGYVCNVTVATSRYPALVRLTGVGWAQGIGRLGGICAPAIIAVMIHEDWTNAQIFSTVSVVALICAGIAYALRGYTPAA